jgi:hypothetical protein
MTSSLQKVRSICPQQANAQPTNTAFPRVYRMHVKNKVGAASNE